MSNFNPKVIIIVLNWNGKHDTYECLKSLNKLIYSNYEIIVVDNASTDGSQKILKKHFLNITLIENKNNLGFGGGFNIGIKIAIEKQAKYVICLNNDVILSTNFIEELIKIGELNNKIGGLYPMEYYYDQPNKINAAGGGNIRFIIDNIYGHNQIDKGQHNQLKEVKRLCGSAIVLKADVLSKIGFFDPIYFYGPEDKDISIRVIKSGYKIIFVPKAKLWHKRRGATGGKITPINVFFRIRNKILFIKKHASKSELFFNILYLGFIYLPYNFITFILLDRKYINAFFKALIWHINRDFVLEDHEIVELLRTN